MSDTLEKEGEADDLLSSVDPLERARDQIAGQSEASGTGSATLEEEGRQDASGVGTKRTDTVGRAVQPYLFGESAGLQVETLPVLSGVVNQLCQKLGPVMQSLAQRPLTVAAEKITVLPYRDYQDQASPAEYIGVFSMNPLQGEGLIGLSSGVVLTVVDLLFGGGARYPSSIEDRTYSRSERRIAERILGAVADSLAEALGEVHPIEIVLNHHGVKAPGAFVAPDDRCIVIGLLVTIEQESHAIRLCLPGLSIEPIRRKLQNPVLSTPPLNHERWMDLLLDQVKAAEVELTAELASTQITVSGLASLKCGDIIDLDMSNSIAVSIESIPVLQCSYGVFNGRYAIRIQKFLTTTEPIRTEPSNGQPVLSDLPHATA